MSIILVIILWIAIFYPFFVYGGETMTLLLGWGILGPTWIYLGLIISAAVASVRLLKTNGAAEKKQVIILILITAALWIAIKLFLNYWGKSFDDEARLCGTIYQESPATITINGRIYNKFKMNLKNGTDCGSISGEAADMSKSVNYVLVTSTPYGDIYEDARADEIGGKGLAYYLYLKDAKREKNAHLVMYTSY